MAIETYHGHRLPAGWTVDTESATAYDVLRPSAESDTDLRVLVSGNLVIVPEAFSSRWTGSCAERVSPAKAGVKVAHIVSQDAAGRLESSPVEASNTAITGLGVNLQVEANRELTDWG